MQTTFNVVWTSIGIVAVVPVKWAGYDTSHDANFLAKNALQSFPKRRGREPPCLVCQLGPNLVRLSLSSDFPPNF
jgi:hypothetical protein